MVSNILYQHIRKNSTCNFGIKKPTVAFSKEILPLVNINIKSINHKIARTDRNGKCTEYVEAYTAFSICDFRQVQK